MEDIWIPYSLAFSRALGLLCFFPLELFGSFVFLRFIAALLLGFCGFRFIVYDSNINALSYAIEFLFGFLITLPFLLLIQAADLWGDLLDSLRGQNATTIFDPFFQNETSHLALLSKSVLWIGLVSAQGLEIIISQYFKSFQISGLDISLWQRSILIFTQVLGIAIKLSLCFAVLCLVVELISVFAAKILPAVSMQAETFTIKMILVVFSLDYLLSNQSYSALKFIFEKLLVI